MLKNPLITTILVFCFLFAHGQKVSKIYNAKGQLIVDTTYTISKRQLKKFTAIEDTLVRQLVDRINYPEVEREAEIQGRTILSFTMNGGDTLKDVRVVKYVPGGAGLGKEAARALKRVKVLKTHHSKQLKDTTYYIAVYYGLGSVPYESCLRNGYIYIIAPRYDRYTIKPLDTPLRKWMDSIAILCKGRWNEIKWLNEAKGQWISNYVGGDPDTQDFYVERLLYPPGDIVSDGGGHAEFHYYSKEKMISSENESIYLANGKLLIYHLNRSYSWGGGGGCFGAYLWTPAGDTIYKGNKEGYVRSPIDTSKYFVFIDNNWQPTSLISFIVGAKKAVFKKEFHHPDGGILIKCKPAHSEQSKAYDMTSDSTDYLLFSPDSTIPFHAGDTMFLGVESHRLSDTAKHTFVDYYSVKNYYPFKDRQIEDVVYYKNSYNSVMLSLRSRSFVGRIFHKREWVVQGQDESDPVFLYLRKNKLVYKY